ncbi:MAG: hypothetical protein L6V93_08405 [Clostridiales bacterium]|nr:MAG: hypothetical protein L6V93_08405 [Clostridiales bacterium]
MRNEKEELEKLRNKFTSKDLSLTGKGIGICNTYKRLKTFVGRQCGFALSKANSAQARRSR